MLQSMVEMMSFVLGLIVLPVASYLGLLAIAAWARRAPPYREPQARFAFVVPAHNEQSQIAATVASLLAVDYPASMRRVVVVADNCSDDTAAVAAAAGAEVWQRHSATRRGKGYALDFAFERLLFEQRQDAIVVVDADTLVSANLLRAFDARLARGAQACQAEYGVRNPHASWRTRLMTLALALFHRLRSLARERLGVSSGLRGNGMCFSAALLRAHPHRAFGLVEDVEYGIELGRARHRVVFAHEAWVRGEMVAGQGASRSQRQRWEGGRFALARAALPGLLSAAARERSLILLDLAIDLAVPPLSYVGLTVAVGLALELVHVGMAGAMSRAAVVWAVSVSALAAYLLRGIALSRLGWRAVVTALGHAPLYAAWKIALLLQPREAAWIRTGRESEQA